MTKLKVNGQYYDVQIEPNEMLSDVLIKKLGLYGVRVSCSRGECASCTVLLDGNPILSCLMLAMQAEGKEITTIEGLGTYDKLHPIQEAFVEEQGFQCGFCTPGMILSTKALLERNKRPNSEEVALALSGHICRCGAYPQIIKSALKAAQKFEDIDHDKNKD
jgi:carbon-monoxide dehydrogenase small subunit